MSAYERAVVAIQDRWHIPDILNAIMWAEDEFHNSFLSLFQALARSTS